MTQQPPIASTPTLERVADAIEQAECHGREGPFGGYLYDGLHVIRDFRDPCSDDWGKWVHQTRDKDEHEAMYRKLTREHIARAALDASGNDELRKLLREANDFECERWCVGTHSSRCMAQRAAIARTQEQSS